MRVLAINAGSSTLKASVVDGDDVVTATTRDWGDDDRPLDRGSTLGAALATLGAEAAGIDAVAHRVVHGGERFTAHALLDDSTLAAIDEVSDLAPLHNIPAVETIRVARGAFADLPHVACFDTAFHAGLPQAAVRYPIPEAWHAAGMRRFGFHGLSVEWAVGRAAALLERPVADLHLVVAHLGSGSSVTAVSSGASAWTSMGYTPLDGLMMATRPGALDPGIILRVLRTEGPDIDRLARALEHESGLRGVSGSTSDVRELEALAEADDGRAVLALEMFVARAAAGIAAAATWLPRLDGLVFTGGIGENAGRVRSAIADRLAALGVDPIGTDESSADRVLGGGSPALIRVAAREDVVMARAAERLVRA